MHAHLLVDVPRMRCHGPAWQVQLFLDARPCPTLRQQHHNFGFSFRQPKFLRHNLALFLERAFASARRFARLKPGAVFAVHPIGPNAHKLA